MVADEDFPEPELVGAPPSERRALPDSGSGPVFLQDDDIKAEFSEFYRRDVKRLVVYLVMLGASPAEAADCAQETMLLAFQDWRNIRHPYAWARKIAGQVYMKRSLGVERPFDEFPPDGQPLLGSRTDQLNEVLNHYEILPAVRKLPMKQRQVLALTLQGETPSLIAEQLDVPSEQVRANLRLARKKIQDYLAEDARREQESDDE